MNKYRITQLKRAIVTGFTLSAIATSSLAVNNFCSDLFLQQIQRPVDLQKVEELTHKITKPRYSMGASRQQEYNTIRAEVIREVLSFNLTELSELIALLLESSQNKTYFFRISEKLNFKTPDLIGRILKVYLDKLTYGSSVEVNDIHTWLHLVAITLNSPFEDSVLDVIANDLNLAHRLAKLYGNPNLTLNTPEVLTLVSLVRRNIREIQNRGLTEINADTDLAGVNLDIDTGQRRAVSHILTVLSTSLNIYSQISIIEKSSGFLLAVGEAKLYFDFWRSSLGDEFIEEQYVRVGERIRILWRIQLSRGAR